MATKVVNNPEQNRYELQLEGELAGFVTYRERPGLIAFVHTETDNRLEGQGLASELISGALDDIRERGLEVLPFCPFANSYIQRHPEYADLVPDGYREQFSPVRRPRGGQSAARTTGVEGGAPVSSSVAR